MRLLPESWRSRLFDPGLSPRATNEENALWAADAARIIRRVRYAAAGKAGIVVLIAGITRFIRHPHPTPREIAITVGLGAFFFFFMFGIFVLQSSSEVDAEKTKFLRARRMHRAILEEPDLEPENESA